MNVSGVNNHLVLGDIGAAGLFPHVERLARCKFVFQPDFGLPALPAGPGVILVRGPRQVGKSTWLEQQLCESATQFGPGTAFYLNGDELPDVESLVRAMEELLPMYRVEAPVRRLFIDEITAVTSWERGLKRLIDRGDLRDVLVVTTGSRATDLRRGAERLPGRKGNLARTNYVFTPIPYSEFKRVCGDALGDDTLPAYMIAGGTPAACVELAATGCISEWVIEAVRDWMVGEASASGRSRTSLMFVLKALLLRGGSPLGQLNLAREAGLANNTVAAGYVELLADLMCVGVQRAWDASKRIPLARKPAKFPFTNLLAATAWHPARIRSVEDFRRLPPPEQGIWFEWLVAQELWRRASMVGAETPEELLYWQSNEHEVDFVVDRRTCIEVKRGQTSPLEFAWFPRTHPGAELLVVNPSQAYEAGAVRAVTFEQFLCDEEWMA